MIGIVWVLFIVLCGLLIFVRNHEQLIVRLFKTTGGVSPVLRFKYSLGALFSLILIFGFCRESAPDHAKEQTQVWIAVFDVTDASARTRAQFLLNDAAQLHQGVAVSLFQVQKNSVAVLVPPTYDLLYFKLIVDTLSNFSARLSTIEVETQIEKIAHTAQTSLIKMALFTDRASEYRSGKYVQIIDVNSQLFQKNLNEVQARPQIEFEQADFVPLKGIQYISLLLVTIASLLFLQAFRPKSLFILVIGFLTHLSAQDSIATIRNAEVFYLQGDYREASTILKDALKTESQNPYLLFNFALCQVALGDYDSASDALITIENRKSDSVLVSLKPHMELVREFMLYQQLQRVQMAPDFDTLSALLSKSAELKTSSSLFQNWLMLAACQYRMQQRALNFSFKSAASVLFSRISQILVAYQNSDTVHREYKEGLVQELKAYIALFKVGFSVYPEAVQKIFTEQFQLKNQYQMDEVISQLDRVYLMSLMLNQDSFENGLKVIFSECIRSSLWVHRSPNFQFLFDERKEFLEELLEAGSFPIRLFVTSSTEYEKVYEDFKLAQLVFPLKNRFYKIIEAIIEGNISDSLLLRALKVVGVGNRDVGTPFRLIIALLREWVDSGFYPSPAVRSQVDGLLALTHAMSYEELKRSTLIQSLRLLIDLPKNDGTKLSGRLYLETVLPYMQEVISHPFDLISTNTLVNWQSSFANYLQQISLGQEAQQALDLNDGIKNVFQVLNGLADNQEKDSALWNQQIAVALEKMQVLYTLLEEKKAEPVQSKESMSYAQKSNVLFDPIQLYKTLEMRDRQLREQIKEHN